MRFFAILAFATIATAGEYTTYIGDSYPRSVAAIASDAAGNTYVAGNRAPTLTPTAAIVFSAVLATFPIGVGSGAAAPNDVFVSKLDPGGNILFTAVFAGKGFDRALAVAVDPTGNVYVAGITTSPDFPLSNALQSQNGAFGAGFIVKLSPDGRTILYSTYFGGLAGSTAINAMTTDAAGNLYLTGTTFATDFPHTSGMPSAAVAQNASSPFGSPISAAFVASISPGGDKILFAGAVAGGNTICSAGPHDCAGVTVSTTGLAIALDAARNVYFGGNTNTTDLPTTAGAFLMKGIGAFAGKIAASGTGLAYLTLIGSAAELVQGPVSSPANVLSSLAADSAGNVYLAGTTGDPKFPVTPGAFQTAFAGGPISTFGVPLNTDGFVAKLNPAGSALLWATYLGGSGNDAVNSIAADAAGNVWATGATSSTAFPDAQGWSQGGDFLVELGPSGGTLPFSARYPNGTVAQAVALDGATFIHTAGATGIVSEIASTTPPSAKIFGVGNVIGGPLAGRVAPAEVISIYGPNIGPATAVTAAPADGFYPTALGGIQVFIGGVPAPLLYVAAGQINAVVPMGLAISSASTVRIARAGVATTPSFPLWIDTSDGELFPGILNQDGSLNSRANPAKLGSAVFFYATGFQTNFANLMDGQIATQAQSIVCPTGTCLASQGTILYEGAAPGIVAGVTQINLQLNVSGVPGGTIAGLQQLSILIENFNTFVTLWVTP